MEYVAKDYSHLLGLVGFSDNLLNTHFTLYKGYVNNVNKLISLLNTLSKDSVEYAETKRRFGWEFNGMTLHELYFDQLSKRPNQIDPKSELYNHIIKSFGSYDLFLADLKSTGLMRGIGWVITYYDKENDLLFNTWINEHDVGHLATLKPILIIDVFEHAFLQDFGTKRIDYINKLLENIDWKIIEKRL